MVFSMKFTPALVSMVADKRHVAQLTQRLNVVFVPAALDIFDHQTGLSNLRVADHANLDDDTSVLVRFLLLLLRRAPLVLVRV
jgi:hypothetical protein